MKRLILLITVIFTSLLTNVSAQDVVKARCVSPMNIEVVDGKARLLAKDFDNASFAYDTGNLRYTFSDIKPSQDPLFDNFINSSFKVLDMQSDTSMYIDIYVWDKDDNSDKCTSEVHFVDNENTGKIYGNIDVQTLGNSTDSIHVELNKINFPYSHKELFPSNNGDYAFSNLESGTYKLSPYKDGNYLDGITTLDIVLIQKHILQLKKFDKLRQFIAGDLSDDRKVDVFDLYQFAKLILGGTTTFNSHSYSYMQKGLSYSSAKEAFEKGLGMYFPIEGDSSKIDFIEIKKGDINGSASYEGRDEQTMAELGITKEDLILNKRNNFIGIEAIGEPSNNLDVSTPNMNVYPGDTVCIPVIFRNHEGLVALQFAVKWDTTMLEYIKMNKHYELLSNVKNNEIFLLANGRGSYITDSIAVELCFRVVGNNGSQTSLSFESDKGFENAFYNSENPMKPHYQSGDIIIGSGCIPHLDIELNPSTGIKTLYAEDLFLGEKAGDTVTVNGQDSITFSCDDFGLNFVTVSVAGENSTIDCHIEINVLNNIKPFARCNNTIAITLNDDYFYELTPQDLDAGSYDICGDTLDFSLSVDGVYNEAPVITFDCLSAKQNYVRLNMTNSRGLYEYCDVLVNVNYPKPNSSTLVARSDTMEIAILPGYGAEVTADMILVGDKTCPNYYKVAVFDSMPNIITSQGNIENPIQNPGLYVVGIFDPNNSNVWTFVKVISPDENTVGLSLPEKTVGENEELCLSLKVENFTDVTSINVPVSWNRDVLGFNKIDNIYFPANYTYDNKEGELSFKWNDVNGKTLADNTTIFDICFTAKAKEVSQTDILFFSPTEWKRPVVEINGAEVASYQKNGKVRIENLEFCSNMLVSLGVDFTKVNASDFSTSDNTTVILVDGEESKYFDCENLGVNIVELTVQHIDGTKEKCNAKVIVEDKISPVIKFNVDTVFMKDDALNLTIDNLGVDVFENCTYNYKITPEVVNCDNSGLIDVYVEANDIAGNKTTENKSIEFICTSDCAVTKIVSLDQMGQASVDAQSFKSTGYNFVLVDGASSIDLNCDDLGDKLVKLTKENNNGDREECYSFIVVKDKVPPVAVCKQNYEVRLNDELIYKLDPVELDNGSYDNCGDLSYTARRINSTDTGVVFDCESDTSEVVELRVTDKLGNYNQCLVNVKINQHFDNLVCNDKIQFSVFPDDSTLVTPDFLLEGEPYCYNHIKVELYDDYDYTQLRNGPFLHPSDYGKEVYAKAIDKNTGKSCQTTVTATEVGNIEFKFPDIIAERNKDICLDLKVRKFRRVTEFKLPISWDNSIVKFKELKLPVNPKLDDIDFYYQSDSKEVIALWKVEDEQRVTLPDSTTLFSLCFNTIGEYESSTDIEFKSLSGIVEPMAKVQNHIVNSDFIKGKITIQKSPEDCVIDTFKFLLGKYNCTKLITADSLYGIAEYGDTVLINGKKEINFGIGSHNIVITVKYLGGGLSRCKSVIEMIDSVPPIVTVEQNTILKLGYKLKYELDPWEFDGGSFDNCTHLSFDCSPKIIDCNSPNPGKVTLYVKDSYGNVSTASAMYEIKYPKPPKNMVCSELVNVEVYPNDTLEIKSDMILKGLQSCPSLYDVKLYDDQSSTTAQEDNLVDISDIGNTYACKVNHPDGEHFCWSKIHIEGSETISTCVMTPRDIPVEHAKMFHDRYTDASGCIDIGNISSTFQIAPSKSTENTDGLNVKDLIIIRKFLLGLINNFTPYQRIAADINNSHSITASDIIYLHRYILGNSDYESPWKFVDKSYTFETGNIFSYPSTIDFPSPDSKYDFIGIKPGDVDFSYGVQMTYDSIQAEITDEVLNKNELMTISVRNSDLITKFEGIQYTLYYNPDSITVKTIKSNIFNVDWSYVINESEGVIKLVFTNILFGDLPADSEIFSIEIEPKVNAVLHDVIHFNQNDNYLVNDDNDFSSIIITKWKNLIPVNSKDLIFDDDIRLYPQPASDYVYVRFGNSSVRNVNFVITNIVGEVVQKDRLNNNRVGVSHLQTGLYFVSFYNKEGKIATKKMIVNR